MTAQLSIFDAIARNRQERDRASRDWWRRWLKGKVQGPPLWIYAAWRANAKGEPLPPEPAGYGDKHFQGV